MRILILGGTVFLGRHVTEAALARGHEPTLFTRGLHGADLFPEAEHVRGDRADLAPLAGRSWDAVIDTSCYVSDHARAAARLDVGHYVFVSTANAYPRWPDEPVDEDSPTWPGDEPGYGPQKAASERVLRAALPGRVALVRAGLLVGPHDNVFRLPWWVRRVAAGGRFPAPGDPARPLQLIDARDLAGWLLDLAERRTAGAFNGTGPSGATTFGGLLDQIVAATGADAEPHWIPEPALRAAGVAPWTELPLWMPESAAGTWRIGTARAQAAGLRCRPLAETVADVHRWLRDGGEAELGDWRAEQRPAPMTAAREAQLLAL
ncbi:NAD-dependent epimerase/dehydratase family protein [Patulibacter defluvii]|uniref:NAD-dependent epimerase/dehydratase family protein n=1 Tax=Patulibacter defluvii TaxID=3095358 RepID=UPI002A748BBE|nr:NAD-dependent epimerase/dehydratase family protein [Patulibacter sp. DM4]